MKKIFVVVVSAFSLLIVSASFAVEPNSMLPNYHDTESQDIATSDKVPDIMAYDPSTLTTVENGEETLSDSASKAISIETIYSKNVRTVNIPLSYGMPVDFLADKKERINFCVIIPYTEREMGTEKDSGLGDISVTTDYLIRLPKVLLDSKLTVKTATGEIEDADVALGTGSYDIGLLVKATWYADKFAFKGGLGYTLTGDYEDAGTEIIYGDDMFLSAGCVYTINDKLSAGGELVFNTHMEDELKYSFGSTYSAGLTTYDLIPTVNYFYSALNMNITGKAVIPVFDDWNNDKAIDPIEDPDREMKFKVEVSKPF